MSAIPYVTLTRVVNNTDGVMGVLMVGAYPVCVTLEPPDRINTLEGGDSCIPPQIYDDCTWEKSPPKGWCYRINDVKGRTKILIHSGNTDDDTAGCILLGTSFGALNGRAAVLRSRTAIKRFRRVIEKSPEFILHIRKAY